MRDAGQLPVGTMAENRCFPQGLAGTVAPEYADPDIVGMAKNRGWLIITSEVAAGGQSKGRKNPARARWHAPRPSHAGRNWSP